MPTYGNPLYANGVPTYSNEVGALGEVFKALAPNPLRDLQIQGYANNARLSKLRGDVIQNQQDSLPGLAAAFQQGGNLQDALPQAILGGNLKNLKQVIDAVPAAYGFRALGEGGNANVDQSALATAVGAAGGNVANTAYGFGANQDRQTAEANMKNDTTMRGQDIRSADSRYGTDVGASTARRAQDIGAENSTYTTNMNFLKPTARSGGTGAGGTNSTGGGSAAGELTPQMLKSLNAGLDELQAGYQLSPEDSLAAKAQIHAAYLAQPKGGRNPALAIEQGLAAVVGPNLNAAKEDNYLSADRLKTLPPEKRAPLPQPWTPPPKVSAAAGGGGMSALQQAVLQGNPNLRKPLNAAQINAAAPAPAAAPTPAANPLVSEAANAIASGAPPAAVIQRLRSMGVSDAEIQAAGL